MTLVKMVFKSPIMFAQGWEDHIVIEKALEINKNDTIVGIIASGDNLLNLMLYEPKKIYGFDISSAQIFEFKLKLAAIPNLDHDEFLTLLGYKGNQTERVKIYRSLSNKLDNETNCFWQKNLKLIKKGLSFQGYWEKFTAFQRYAFKFLLGKDYWRMVNSESRTERYNIYQKRINRSDLEFLIKVPRRIIYEVMFNPKGRYGQNVPSIDHIINRDKQRNFHNFVDVQIKNNPYRYWALTGKMPDNNSCWQSYLQVQNYEKLRKNIHKITIIQNDIKNGLKPFENGSIDKFYLSDIFCWMNPKQMEETLTEVVRVARNNSKIIYFVISYDKGIPESLKKNVRTDMIKNKKLWELDRYGFYSDIYQLDVVK